MKRRSFLKSIGAASLAPFLPSAAIPNALASSGAGASTMAIAPETYKWAEMIVRAHNSCSSTLLERHLRLSAVQAAKLQITLFKNGVIGTKNAYGIAKATNPLWEGAFPKSGNVADKLVDGVKRVGETLKQDCEKQTDLDEESTSTIDLPEDETISHPSDMQDHSTTQVS